MWTTHVKLDSVKKKGAKVSDEFEPEKSVSNINQTNSAVAEQPHNQLHTDLFPRQPGQLKKKKIRLAVAARVAKSGADRLDR
jgi:hypothetical protein